MSVQIAGKTFVLIAVSWNECSKDDWNTSCPGCLKLIAKVIPKLARENVKLRRENADFRNNKLQEKSEQ